MTAGVVYNDGVPAMVACDHDIVQGYEEEAMDENFPPTAEEAAELEAVEIFVEMMAMFSLMEEKEEKARSSYCHLQKRWETRREEGLVGKPRPAMNLIDAVDHNHVGKPVSTTELVPFAHSNRTALVQGRRQSRQEKPSKSKARVHANPGRTLQQPRKQN